MKAAAVLMLAGVWIASQVLKGGALDRILSTGSSLPNGSSQATGIANNVNGAVAGATATGQGIAGATAGTINGVGSNLGSGVTSGLGGLF